MVMTISTYLLIVYTFSLVAANAWLNIQAATVTVLTVVRVQHRHEIQTQSSHEGGGGDRKKTAAE
jgi:hypothetical protein